MVDEFCKVPVNFIPEIVPVYGAYASKTASVAFGNTNESLKVIDCTR